MKTFKIFFSVAVLIAIIVFHFVLNAVQPEVATSLALEQFENPSIATDTAMRTYNNSNFYWLAYVGWVLFVAFVFQDKIKEIINDA